jgi:hypothetical protein
MNRRALEHLSTMLGREMMWKAEKAEKAALL